MKTALKQTILSVFLTFLISLPFFYVITWMDNDLTPFLYIGLRVVRFVVMLVLAVRLRKHYQDVPFKNWNVALLVLLAVGLAIHFSGFFQHNQLVVYLNLMNRFYEQQAIVPFITLEQLSYPDLYWGLLLGLEIVFFNHSMQQTAVPAQN